MADVEQIKISIQNHKRRKLLFKTLGLVLTIFGGVLTVGSLILYGLFVLKPVFDKAGYHDINLIKKTFDEFVSNNQLMVAGVYCLFSIGIVLLFGGIAFLIVKSVVCQRMVEKREKQLKNLESSI